MDHSTVSQPALRRAIDVVGSLVLLVLFAPALLGAILALMLEGAGPVFTTRLILARGGQRIRLFELRIEGEDRFDRFTALGRFLWVTRINQLPMLVNVLRGDLSFEDPLVDYLESAD
jgi:lipopolysaccharide/colanic/teichoic acid biosynthesis glycosyltransferase